MWRRGQRACALLQFLQVCSEAVGSSVVPHERERRDFVHVEFMTHHDGELVLQHMMSALSLHSNSAGAAAAPATPNVKVSVGNGSAPVNMKKTPVLIEDIKVPVKEPIFIAPINVIPSVYDRGVGQPIAFAANGRQESFYNMSGYCSENVQNACRCSSEKKGKYTLDIPQLP